MSIPDEVATHDNTLEADPDPIVNGDDVVDPAAPRVDEDDDDAEADEGDESDLGGG